MDQELHSLSVASAYNRKRPLENSPPACVCIASRHFGFSLLLCPQLFLTAGAEFNVDPVCFFFPQLYFGFFINALFRADPMRRSLFFSLCGCLIKYTRIIAVFYVCASFFVSFSRAVNVFHCFCWWYTGIARVSKIPSHSR